MIIKIKRATRSQLNSAAGAGTLIQGEPYLITDEDKIAIGLSTTTYEVYARGFLEQFPVDINRYGFLNQTETTIAFDGTSVFTLGSVGASWSYYRAGLKYTITGNKTIDLTTVDETLVDGALYFIYIDATDGTLSASRTAPWTLNDTKVPVALLVWDDTLTPKFWLADERHTVLIDRREHYRVHLTEGTRPISVGELDGYTVNEDVNADKVFSIAESKIIDEDIILTLGNLTKPDGTDTDYTVFYRTDADTWAWKASNMPFVYNVGNTNNWIQWDNAGTMTDATGGTGSNTRWVNSYLILTNFSGAARFAIISGQNIYTTLAAAQAEAPSSFTWGTFPIAECVIVYRITWSTVTSTSQGQCRLAAVPQAISVSPVKTLVSGGSIDHNTLAGLNAGDYQHLTVAEKALIHKDYTETTVNLTAAGWSTSTQTEAITGLTSASDVMVFPPQVRAAFLAYGTAQISATAVGTDSITFTCTDTPDDDIDNIIVLWR